VEINGKSKAGLYPKDEVPRGAKVITMEGIPENVRNAIASVM
jgi:hypothetical protein